eukprot:CAMPEP_0175034738 /NCGR_PEP_ID=MMETSP0005-20121125/22819_1 /TAXON_ID=420556 /ORGANISM="Ochromonas sp., Strain CCMP1393" /LENGTH=32 /DNA_ID= /DNA_START= /DNA_END= /DNA_ORIENTATION=
MSSYLSTYNEELAPHNTNNQINQQVNKEIERK